MTRRRRRHPDRGRLHPIDATAVVLGATFTGLGLWFLADASGSTQVDLGWVWPLLLMGLGVAGLLVNRPGRDRTDGDP